MSLLKSNAVQIGQSLTPTNNFVWYQPEVPDGTIRLANGNSGSTTDILTINSIGNATFVGSVTAYGTTTSAADLKLYEDTDNGNNYVALKAPASIANNVTWTLPTADGSSGQLLATDGSGTLSWSTVSLPTFPNGTIVGTTDTQTLTNKTLTSPTINTPIITGTKETQVALSGTAIDLSTGNYFTKTISGATTLTVSNVPTTGTAVSFILNLTNGGSATITWWSGVKWAGGTVPVLTTSGRDVLAFYTYDGGTTWSGFLLGKDIK